ncbi:MAG: flagellar biosynthesis protein FlgM [Clostridia bacterium]|nr:flagellar biosynthesis protein FlgM [Clostridia bacterium]
MKYPNIWGAGALFCHSGMSEECVPTRAMCGRLMGDFIGVDFDNHDVQLLLRTHHARGWEFDAVASDIILGRINGTQTFCITFAAQDAVVGCCPTACAMPVLHGDLLQRQAYDMVEVYERRGAAYALATDDGEETTRFALVRDPNADEAARRAEQLIHALDVRALCQQRLAYFDALPQPCGLNDAQERTLSKCYSIMKSQIYSPVGRFGTRWTTPDRLPHRHLWLWDSVFHSFGNVYISPELAKETLLAVLDGQREDGFVPHMILTDRESDVTQPPVLAWGFWQWYERTEDPNLLFRVFGALQKYLAWNEENRAGSIDGLFSWYVDPNDPNCRCGESGMDNSPRFDGERRLNCVDFSCFMANEMRCMEKIAAVLGQTDAAAAYAERYQRIKDAIETHLYDETDGRYYDRGIESGEMIKVAAVSSFLPLFAGVCSRERATLLLADLQNPAAFGTVVGVPSIAASDATFGSDMWRGPVWINYNYMIIRGLRDYGFAAAADTIRAATLAAIEKWYLRDGCVYEFYDCTDEQSPAALPRKGKPLRPADDTVRYPSVRDYGWSAALYAALRCE